MMYIESGREFIRRTNKQKNKKVYLKTNKLN